MSLILTGREAIDAADAGGKARALAAAEQAGLPVPPWFVVSGDALAAAIAAVGAGPPSRAADVHAGPQRADTFLAAGIEDALRRLSPSGELLAVRSSASDEDGAQHSFAGQLETFLNVPPSGVPDRVQAVWRSGFSDRILAYRRERALGGQPRPPSVLVQRMVRARTAGVAFSADPVSGRRGVAVVSAVFGLGSAIVSGEADADTWHVDRRGAIFHRHVAAKRRMHVADAAAPGGTRSAEVPDTDAERPSLDDGEVRAVADLARRCARLLGRPQDIEWAFEDDRLLLLQSRPITSLESVPDPDGVLGIWDNSNIVESYSGVTTPLTFSFAREIYEHVYRQFCRLMRVPEPVIGRHGDTFRNMLGLVRGRLYYNLLNWYRVLALLPGFTLNRRFMEQMMGVKEALPPALADEIARSNTQGRSPTPSMWPGRCPASSPATSRSSAASGRSLSG
jgi:pyruvate,water dikinase